MNLFVLFSFLFLPVCQSQDDILMLFKNHIYKYKLQLEEGSSGFNKTLQIFKENVKTQHILTQSQPTPSAKYGITKFSHLSPEEFREIYLSDLLWLPRLKVVNQTQTTPLQRLKQLNIPQSLDWRSHLNFSVVSPIKNQKKCGGCWAFSTVETVESMVALKKGVSPPHLSVQQVIDCSSNNDGCQGGDTCRALQWMVSSKTPLVSDVEYPLTDVSNYCKIEPAGTQGVLVKHNTCEMLVGMEQRTLEMLQNGPVVAAVDATTWSNYQGGIIMYHCGSQTNHAVQIVGYDISGEVPYYIVRNSWGSDFGHNGYIYIKIGENVCGIGTEISSVQV